MPHPIEQVLDDIHSALLVGDFEGLPSLLHIFEAEEQALNQIDSQTARRLQKKSVRNAACLRAAIVGFKIGKQRISEIVKSSHSLGVYEKGGMKSILPFSNHIGKRI